MLNTVPLNLAADLLRSFGELRLSALGGSMVPTIFPGDVLTIQREDAAEVECGQVVLGRRGDRFFIHRVLRKWESAEGVRLLTRGDALSQPDPPLAEGEVLGQVICIERGAWKIPVRRHLTWIEKCVQWGVRQSDLFLRIILHAHSLRQLRRFKVMGAPMLGLTGMQKKVGSWNSGVKTPDESAAGYVGAEAPTP